MNPTEAPAPPQESGPPEDLGSSPVETTGPITSSTAAATWALFAGFGLLMMGNGLQGSLLGIRSESEGFSTFATGAVMACYFAGFLFGSKMAIKALGNVGHIRVFAALASMASTSVLIHAIAVTPVTWALMRFVTGLCFAGLYVVAESWLNEMATNQNRGRLLAIYMVVGMGGLAAGQLFLNFGSPDGFELFVVASVMVSLAAVPVSLSASSAPPLRQIVPFPIREVWRIVPSGVVTSFFGGMAAGALMGMGAVYAANAGLSPGRIGLFMAAPMIGAVILQFPIGIVSDRVPRRGVIFVVALAAMLVSVALVVVDPATALALVLMAVLGGTMFPLYSLGIAYTNDWLPQDKILGAASGLVFINGLGAVCGPLLASALIFGLDNSAFFWSTAVTHAAIVAYIGYRIVAKDGVRVEDQGDFMHMPARASASAAQLLVKRVPKPKLKKPQIPKPALKRSKAGAVRPPGS